MLHFSRLLSLSVLAMGCLMGCDKTKTNDPSVPTICFPNFPQACVSGVVLRDMCYDGVLIQVDRSYPIGKPLPNAWVDSLGTDNVIAAVNSLGALAVRGQRVYFTYINDPTRQAPNRPCPTYAMAGPIPIPHLVLSNVSGTPCGPQPPL